MLKPSPYFWATSPRTYDAAHRLTSVTDADGRKTKFEYDATGRRVVTEDAELKRSRNVYDAAGQLLQSIRAENTPKQQTYAEMTYSLNGRKLTKKDARGNITTNLYDGFDRLSRTTHTDATYDEYAYDAVDNVSSQLRRNGQLITMSYDTLNRVATKVVPQPGGAPAVQTTFAYDLASRLTQVSDTNGHTVSYTFDTAKRPVTATQAGPGIPTARTVSYQYDAAGNRTRLTWPDAYYVQYAYDALNRLATATENGTFVLATYTYDPLSRPTGMANGNGTSASASYSTGADLLSLVNNFTGSSVTQTHTFSPTHKMVSETASNAVWDFAPATFETTAYATANPLNQYTQVTKGADPTVTLSYDASGNLTGDGTWTFAYDAENKMTAATKAGTAASYAYDPLLRRTGKTVNGVTTTFLLDGAEEIGDYDGAGGMLRRYVPSNSVDAPVATVEGTGAGTVRKWFHRNRLGSTIALSDGTGTLAEGPLTYDPFGNSAATGGVPFKYTGRRFDAETGLYYYRARYYAPALGRFMQVDPIGSCDDMNLYGYVANDPVNATDPSGTSRHPLADGGSGVETITVTGDRLARILEEMRQFNQDLSNDGLRRVGSIQSSNGEALEARNINDPRDCTTPGACPADDPEKVTVTADKKPKPPSVPSKPGFHTYPAEKKRMDCRKDCQKKCEVASIDKGFERRKEWGNRVPPTFDFWKFTEDVLQCTSECYENNCVG